MFKMEAIVKYGNGKARFIIQRETPGVYFANLVSFVGDKTKTPPTDITLIRGIRHWAGSFDDDTLLNALGSKIEESCK